jgi:hypothetical protein
MATKENDDVMHIEEDQDGTVTVDLPEGILPKDDNDTASPADDGEDDHPGDSEAVRAARRARRRSKKDLIRTTNAEKDVRLQVLQRQNDDLMNRLSNVERKTQAYDTGRLDKAIEDKQVAMEYARMKLAEATNSGDGEGAVKAQELLYDTRQQLQQLAYQRKQSDQAEKPTQTIDPNVQRNASTWIERNDWYKQDLSDTDSKIAKQVDEVLVKEGWNPGTADYWDELDARLQKELPHRYNGNNDDDSRNVRRPRNVVGSSGREASAAYGGSNRSQFVLSPDRVRAMKEAGAWDNPERKAKMIKQFIAYDRQNRNN